MRQDIVEEMAIAFEFPQPDEKVIKYNGDRFINEWIAEHFVTSPD